MFILLSVGLAALLVAALILPVARPGAAPNVADPVGDTLKGRLAEIDADLGAGLIDGAEAEEAKVEAKRAALAAVPAPLATANSKLFRLAAIGAAGLAPPAAVLLYLQVGAPNLIDAKIEAARSPTTQEDVAAMAPADRAAMINQMVAGLEARLKENPEDAEGWRMLARSKAALGDTEAAAQALRELLKRAAGDAEDWRSLAGALMALGPGEGREAELKNAMARLETLSPDEPLALYYLGSEALAAGERAKARDYLERLLKQVPPDAPVRPAIEKLLEESKGA